MPRPRTRSRLGDAIYRARKAAKLSQDELGAAVDLPQPRVSDWEGETHLEVEEALDLLGRMDIACGNARGSLLDDAGYIDLYAPIDVTRAIRSDPRLDEAGREAVLYAYRYCVSVSKPVDDIAALDDDLAQVERDLGITGPPGDGNGEPVDVDDRPA